MLLRTLLCAAALLTAVSSNASRRVVSLDADWHFRLSHQVDPAAGHRVDLPHTWNAQDALAGDPAYLRGVGNYTRTLHVPEAWRGRRLFLRFEGANTVTDLFVNGRYTGTHRGGYGAFLFEITHRVEYGADNTLSARVDNALHLDVMPLVGDFNFYGGLYRGVKLLVTDPLCISPLDCASPGVYLTTRRVTAERADVSARILVDNSGDKTSCELRLIVRDGDRAVAERSVKTVAPVGASDVTLDFSVPEPHLWQGRRDPHLYTVEISLWRDGCRVDAVEQPLGLRTVSVDPERGFLLNGEPLPLHGVCRHQDRAGFGNALLPEHHVEDMALIAEMGANAVRLAHYPQATEVYDLCDRYGLVVWAEIPFVGPGGYADKGFVDSPAFRANGREQLRELIRQHYNHPSICMWGLFNELREEGDNPVEYIRELNALAHDEDPSRPTTAASNRDGALNFITDLIAWNRYDGWYGGTPADLGRWLDGMHGAHPGLCIGVSEYGAGASPLQQQDTLLQPAPAGRWHPENWQTHYHIENLRTFSARPYVWGTFVWNMFDFGAAHRTEGAVTGINDKGLVTFDRRTRKDAYYFYQVNWTPQPQVYISGRRHAERMRPEQTITVFSNCPATELLLGGVSQGVRRPDSVCVAAWELTLAPGVNRIEVRGSTADGRQVYDACEIRLVE